MTKNRKGTKVHIHTPMPLPVKEEIRRLLDRYQSYPGISGDLRRYLSIAEGRDALLIQDEKFD
jgi:hypothetical protein